VAGFASEYPAGLNRNLQWVKHEATYTLVIRERRDGVSRISVDVWQTERKVPTDTPNWWYQVERDGEKVKKGRGSSRKEVMEKGEAAGRQILDADQLADAKTE
jgi:hypothetical protein